MNDLIISTKYTFSGHDSFQCRQLWLKKGIDFVQEGQSFNSEDAVVKLGVGKNMVSAIRFLSVSIEQPVTQNELSKKYESKRNQSR